MASMESLNPSSSSLRVLTRHSASSTSPSLPHTPDQHFSTAPSPPSSRNSDGVVVVGFIGRGDTGVVGQLIDRIIDGNVFGSGGTDTEFPTGLRGVFVDDETEEGAEDWFRWRRISYHYEEEKGMVFLQFVRSRVLVSEGVDLAAEEDQEFGDLQGMLFMFSVCHVLIFLQDGSRFDTQMLKKFRILQSAKHSLVPFIKSRIKPMLPSRSSSSAQSPVPSTSSKNTSPGRGVSVIGRHASAISLMSGLSSNPSLFPGQCTPVVLFVFLDDFSDGSNAGSNVEHSSEASSSNQSSHISSLARSSLPIKASSPVVVLARPATKSEGGLRKKLHSSLEAQIRFLIKKIRSLAVSESSSAGSRGGGNASLGPLFSLENSRAVALIERSANQRGESLDFATSLVEDILNAKAASDILLLESHGHISNKEDIQSVIEFISRQSDILRGRANMLANTNTGSAAGVGMVAVAAAAAAASAASGKPIATPELPSLGTWLSCSQLILDALLSARRGFLDKNEILKRKPVRRNSAAIEKTAMAGVDPVEAALSWLESGNGLNMKFSTAWCQRALPAAKGVYLKDLPACYPTTLHESQLQKALRAFNSMVKGPAVEIFRQKLEDECAGIWRSGRQLCDAVSLTGKPCMHQRHNVGVDGPVQGSEVKPHSSGFVFLHACSCGRLRRLRDDPFDFDSANITFNHFPDCDDLLPALKLPKLSCSGPIQPSSWSLIRVGSARYYQPSKGLLQSGFCPTEKYLLKWSIVIEKPSKSNDAVEKLSIVNLDEEAKIEHVSDQVIKTSDQSFQGEVQDLRPENHIKNSNKASSEDQKISFGKGLPRFNMQRPFAEVVAGSITSDAAFPPLQQKKLPAARLEKATAKHPPLDGSNGPECTSIEYQGSQKSEDVSSTVESSPITDANIYEIGNPFLHIGSNLVPVNMNAGGKIKPVPPMKQSAIYVGFEHECSYGHRFLLTSKHLNGLGSLYSIAEESRTDSSLDCSDRKVTKSLHVSDSRENIQQLSRGGAVSVNKVRASSEEKQNIVMANQCRDGFLSSGTESTYSKFSSGFPSNLKAVRDLDEGLQHATDDDNGCAFSLLNRNIPIYMNCPHCRVSKGKVDQQKIKFASSVSQLQRIFLVTPLFPIVLAACPVVQFQASCLPPSVMDCERQSKFSIGCRVILPPDSFLTIRLPFVYGVQREDKNMQSLKPLEHQPEQTAWVIRGSVLQVMSKGGNPCGNSTQLEN
ncbi:hypothetical protein Syun_000720 [Stephania yunnanensis]|uniref:Nonsense-mediated mRNA decay factor SMG8 n=1 Tax=Stephania yunnanensis TaxID=152371 RepID=A0AAP0Q5U2_9MAGN